MLQGLTQEAVKFQKTMNQINKGQMVEKPNMQVSRVYASKIALLLYLILVILTRACLVV